MSSVVVIVLVLLSCFCQLYYAHQHTQLIEALTSQEKTLKLVRQVEMQIAEHSMETQKCAVEIMLAMREKTKLQ